MSLPPESTEVMLRGIRERYPDTPFLALGQTIWWDEPVKAILRRLLDEWGLGGTMVLGVHDTDYFAKARVREAGDTRYELLPHNDGSTRDLWSAAGEISRLLGAECPPTRHDLVRHGVPLHRLAAASPDGALAFVDKVTEAWGWRGLVYTGARDRIVRDMKLSHVGRSIERLLGWGFEGTAAMLADPADRARATQVGDALRAEWIAFCDGNPDARLADGFLHLLPRLYELLLGQPAGQVELTTTSRLLRFNRGTAALPRFSFVDTFIRPATRQLAARAYDRALSGGEMYQLAQFGLGAIPFDLVVPRHGRGTLRITLRAIHIETPEPIRIPLARPIEDIHDLAAVVEDHLGDDVTLVGKAVALISMLAREFLFLFNEEGSAYVSRTRVLNDALRAAGIDVKVHPIVRMRNATWNSLADCPTPIRLPEHLSRAFGAEQIRACDFAAKWQEAVAEQQGLLQRLAPVRKPAELLALLAEVDGDGWSRRAGEMADLRKVLCGGLGEVRKLAERSAGLYSELAEVRAAIRTTELARSAHFRAVEDWTDVEVGVRERSAAELDRLHARRREILAEVRSLRTRRLATERSGVVGTTRDRIAAIRHEAESARMKLVRDALMMTASLVHADHRPTAWWMPMVDGQGTWFGRMARSVELYCQPLLSD